MPSQRGPFNERGGEYIGLEEGNVAFIQSYKKKKKKKEKRN